MRATRCAPRGSRINLRRIPLPRAWEQESTISSSFFFSSLVIFFFLSSPFPADTSTGAPLPCAILLGVARLEVGSGVGHLASVDSISNFGLVWCECIL